MALDYTNNLCKYCHVCLSFTDHAVSQPISMGTGRRVGVGTGYHHQASEVGTVLSPRSRFVCFFICCFVLEYYGSL